MSAAISLTQTHCVFKSSKQCIGGEKSIFGFSVLQQMSLKDVSYDDEKHILLCMHKTKFPPTLCCKTAVRNGKNGRNPYKWWTMEMVSYIRTQVTNSKAEQIR